MVSSNAERITGSAKLCPANRSEAFVVAWEIRRGQLGATGKVWINLTGGKAKKVTGNASFGREEARESRREEEGLVVGCIEGKAR